MELPSDMKTFQSFRLDATNHCLWNGEERVRIPPKAFDVLRYLVENPERLVTQDELLEALWPDTYVNLARIRNRGKVVLGQLTGHLKGTRKTLLPKVISKHYATYRELAISTNVP
jgi:Transcriptional regulatory protein, C terminal